MSFSLTTQKKKPLSFLLAIHLSAEERYELVAATRRALDAAGLPDHPIIAGTGTASVKESIRHCRDAARAGADAAIVIAPGYFAGALNGNRAALKSFFTEIAQHSPIPIMLYNFPACVAGIDLDSDLLIEISQHPNVIGAKLTCAQVGKGGRIVDAIKRSPFHVMTGFADILLPSMTVGLSGTICGTANIAPRTCVQLYNLIKEALDHKDFDKLIQAQKLQSIVSRADWAMFKGGIGGTKWALERYYYPVGVPRLPLPPASQAAQSMIETEIREILEIERKLDQQAGATPAKA